MNMEPVDSIIDGIDFSTQITGRRGPGRPKKTPIIVATKSFIPKVTVKNQSIDVAAAFETIKAARSKIDFSLLKKDISTVSIATSDLYKSIFKKLDGETPESGSKSRSAYYLARAAVRYSAKLRVQDSMRFQEKMQKLAKSVDQSSIDYLSAKLNFLKAATDFENAVNDLENVNTLYPQGSGAAPSIKKGSFKKSVFAEKREALTGVSFSKTKSKSSKRMGLIRLSDGWRDAVVNVARAAGSKYTAQIAAMALTGCRPEELTSGVLITLDAAGQLIATIKNAKSRVGKKDGNRTLTFRPDSSSSAALLARSASDEGGELIVSLPPGVNSKKALRSALVRFGEKAGIKNYGVTGYSFRHQMMSDAKANGLTDDEIAKIAGHSSELTQSAYGNLAAGTSGSICLPVDISSDKTVTRTKKLSKEASLNLLSSKRHEKFIR